MDDASYPHFFLVPKSEKKKQLVIVSIGYWNLSHRNYRFRFEQVIEYVTVIYVIVRQVRTKKLSYLFY